MTKITISLTAAEHDLFIDAARALGVSSHSAFARAVLLDKAHEILADRGAPSTESKAALPAEPSTLHVYVGESLPADALRPAVLFPSIRDFVARFSDGHRAALRLLVARAPTSVAELGQGLPLRNYDQLTGNLRRLHERGLVGYEHAEDGRRSIPRLLHTRVLLILLLTANAPRTILRTAIAAAPDETVPPDADRVFTSISEFSSVIADRDLRLLRLIGRERPETVSTLARLAGHPPTSTHRRIRRLEEAGLIQREGRPARPVLCYDAITLELIFEA